MTCPFIFRRGKRVFVPKSLMVIHISVDLAGFALFYYLCFVAGGSPAGYSL